MDSTPSLAERFRAALPADAARRAGEIADLDDMIRRLLEAGRGLAGELVVDDDAFLRHLARSVAPADDLEQALLATRGPDLYFACACAMGDRRAVAMLDKQLTARIPQA